jgi:glycosyltransferase involved in cell wall biosynthesis
LIPRGLRSPYVVWVHGIEVWKELPKRKLQALQKAELLVFNSNFTRQRFESFHGSEFPTRIVHLTATRGEEDRPAARQARQPWILTVGRLEPGRPKGHQQILAAMPAIAAAVPDVQWHVVGAGRGLEPFRELVWQSPVKNRIQLHGFLEQRQLDDLFRECRVFAMPSFGEGFGIVYLEAMQRGCIAVGSTLDAASEVIGDGGVCLDPNDGPSLQRELIGLLQAPEPEFQQRSGRARGRAAAFSEAKFQTDLIAALQTAGRVRAIS